MKDYEQVTNLIDVESLQAIQDNCAKALGLAFVAVDYRGVPITEYSGFTSFCSLIRQDDSLMALCERCDAHGGLRAAISEQPCIYRCHAGLVDFAVPFILEGSYIGAVLGGQVRLSDAEPPELERILPSQTTFEMSAELEKAYQEIEPISYEKLCAAVDMIRCVLLFSMQCYHEKDVAEELAQKSRELRAERDIRSDLEYAVQQRKDVFSRQEEGFGYFYFVMNMLANLSQQGKSEELRRVLYDYVDLVRYITDPDDQASTLGEELDCVAAFLRILKAWYQDDFSFDVSVSERCKSQPCTRLMLQRIAEGLLLASEESMLLAWKRFEIAIEVDGSCVALRVAVSEAALKESAEDLDDFLEASVDDLSRALLRESEDGCRLPVSVERQGGHGASIRFRLPLT